MSSSPAIWKFSQPPNLAVITTKKIIERTDWIAYATHDADDAGWQFHGQSASTTNDAVVVSLREITELDASVLELFDLPVGCHAWRTAKNMPWRREGE